MKKGGSDDSVNRRGGSGRVEKEERILVTRDYVRNESNDMSVFCKKKKACTHLRKRCGPGKKRSRGGRTWSEKWLNSRRILKREARASHIRKETEKGRVEILKSLKGF